MQAAPRHTWLLNYIPVPLVSLRNLICIRFFFFSFFYLFKSIFENFRYAFAVLMWEIIMQDVAYKDARPLAIKKEVQAGKRQEINTIGKNNNK